MHDRGGIKAEKPMVGISRNKFWYSATCLFLLWFTLLCFYFSGLRSDRNHAALLRNNLEEIIGNSNGTTGEEPGHVSGAIDNFFTGGDWDKYIKDAEKSSSKEESTPDDEIRLTTHEAKFINKVSGSGNEQQLSDNVVPEQENVAGKVNEAIPEKTSLDVEEPTPDGDIHLTNSEAGSINKVFGMGSGELSLVVVPDKINVAGKINDTISEQPGMDVEEPIPDDENGLTNHKARSINKILGQGREEPSDGIVPDKESVNGNFDNTIPEQLSMDVKEPNLDDGNLLTNYETRSFNKVYGKGNEELPSGIVPTKENLSVEIHGTIPEQPILDVEGDQERIASKPEPDLVESCVGKYIYVHDIPSYFNVDYLQHCRSLNPWSNMCPYVSNFGLGPRLIDSKKVFSKTGWFETNQFMLEVIFHNRMKQYKCLTNDSALASAIFVPYYAGLDVARYLWNSHKSMKDHYSKTLIAWLRERPEWKRMWGRDHFLVAGRITWDFRRETEGNSDWGNKLMLWPESKNMTMLTIESSPWHSNDFGIPYPTYFHPSSDNEVLQWQERMRRIKRRFLFSFVGAARPNIHDSIRKEIIGQCQAARMKCKLLECVKDSSKCYQPVYVMKTFQGSTFCLQPPGDSFTRRSTFDSILAGCIPVFFHPGSAYVQYLWHLPRDYTKYSVFIPANKVKERNVSIESILSQIPRAKMLSMREQVINLIPGVVYADPTSNLETFQDAFDITIDCVLERIEGIRKDIREGKNDRDEEFTWKKNLFGSVGKHEWDSFFERS